MGKFQAKFCILICWALMLMYSTAQRQYFIQPRNLTWEDARNHCQACFKELVTLTPDNIQVIARKINSDHWIGLRKNFNSTGNSTSNLTSTEESYPLSFFTSFVASSFTSNFTSNFTDNATNYSRDPFMNWTRWANGDPLTFQNWYPGWPMPKPPPKPPKRHYCCSCSCTCPAKPTTQKMTTSTHTGNSTDNGASFTPGISLYNISNQNMKNMTTQTTTPSFTTSAPWTTTEPPIEAECVRSPMLEPEEPEDDESDDGNYIEDSCVAMLSFGPWIEKGCLDLLPFICYEDRFFGAANVTNITSESANLTWTAAPGDISHYRVEVKGDKELMFNLTDLTYDLISLTAGTLYKVQVFPVKCERDLNPENITFYTVPYKVTNLTVSDVKERSVNLSWNKPNGNLDFYLLTFESQKVIVGKEALKVDHLIPGSFYNFTILSGVKDNSTWSDPAHISVYTKPDKVSNLTVFDNTDNSVMLKWEPPEGNFTDIHVIVMNRSDYILDKKVVNQSQQEVKVTNLPPGTEIILVVTVQVNQGNQTLEGDNVTISSFTTPGPILNLTLTTTNKSLSATWSPPVGSYSSFTANLSLDEKVVNSATGLNETKVLFDTLQNAANYTVTVYAVSGVFKSLPVTFSKFTLPSPPTNATTIKVKKESITFVWTAPENTATPTYIVTVNSSFWGQWWSNETRTTNYTFHNLTSGTRYSFTVRAMAGNLESEEAKCDVYTEPDMREISLSMLCLSAEPLLCDDQATRNSVFEELKKHFSQLLEGHIAWYIEQENSPK